MPGREDAEPQPDGNGEGQCHGAELERHGPDTTDELSDGFTRALVRIAKLEAQGIANVEHILLPERLVQSIGAEDVCLRLLGERHPLFVVWPAWDQVHEGEGDDRDDDQDASEATEPDEDIPSQRPSPRSLSSPPPKGCRSRRREHADQTCLPASNQTSRSPRQPPGRRQESPKRSPAAWSALKCPAHGRSGRAGDGGSSADCHPVQDVDHLHPSQPALLQSRPFFRRSVSSLIS